MDHQRNPLTDGRSGDRRVPSETRAAGSEDLHLRNDDHRWGYDVEVVVATPDGDPVFRRRYYLQPGGTNGERDLLPGGEYELRVTLDNSREEALECRIDPSPDHTAVVEVGNGALSLTEGLHP